MFFSLAIATCKYLSFIRKVLIGLTTMKFTAKSVKPGEVQFVDTAMIRRIKLATLRGTPALFELSQRSYRDATSAPTKSCVRSFRDKFAGLPND